MPQKEMSKCRWSFGLKCGPLWLHGQALWPVPPAAGPAFPAATGRRVRGAFTDRPHVPLASSEPTSILEHAVKVVFVPVCF